MVYSIFNFGCKINDRWVHEQSCAGEIDLSQFNPGIYNVELTDGEIREARKVVVH